MEISLVSLRSALNEERAIELNRSSAEFLKSINLDGSLHFHKGEAGKQEITLFFVESGGSEVPFLQVYQNYRSPFYLLTTGDSNSLASSLEILSFLHDKKMKGEIIYGSNEKIYASIKRIYDTETAAQRLSSYKVGVIGKPSSWLISSSVDHEKAEEKYGIKYIDITFEEFDEEISKNSFPKEKVGTDILALADKNPTFLGALYIYGALKRVVAKYGLDGFSIRCFDLLGTRKNTACLALALLNDEGIVSSCEGDEASLFSMMVFRALGVPAFQCNPSVIDIEQSKIILAHCTMPLCMAESYSFMSHFESDLGVGIRGKFYLRDATLFKMSQNLEDYHCFHGTIEENLERKNLCRSQILLHSDTSLSPILENPYGNHLLLAYGDLLERIERLLARYE
jgi:L-fucose isomerase-like protein